MQPIGFFLGFIGEPLVRGGIGGDERARKSSGVKQKQSGGEKKSVEQMMGGQVRQSRGHDARRPELQRATTVGVAGA